MGEGLQRAAAAAKASRDDAPELVWRVTFGQRYRHEPHPVLGDIPDLPDRYVTVHGPTEHDAHLAATAWLGQAWAFLYPTTGPPGLQLSDEHVPLGEYVPPDHPSG